ncbi:hypothetical protein [Streptomyces sp. CB03911]|uniref:BACON domain-containing protein n=1 Tax=Streptomyces sp. CB03911 TaxID=1804758 RepID=UPI0018FED25D|nr:hypothetical protein [Streptomyces sp. CB03911]
MTTRTERSRNPVLAAYDSRLDGLFTYCLSVLCEHEAAVEAVQEVRELALRHGERLAEPGLLGAWLYSLARYCCLHRLERGPAGAPEGLPEGTAAGSPARAGDHRGELAALAWPEAAGTDPEQREALELAVRHRLSPIEVAAVLGVPADTARALLASGGTEVRRTRAALLVLLVGNCPELDRLAGAGAESWCGPVSAGRGPQPDGGRGGRVLGPGLRRELVQHVVDCPTCRGTAERVAGEVREGLTGLPGLPMLSAPAAARSGPADAAGAGAGAADASGAVRAAGAAERSGPGLAAVPAPATPGPRPAPATATPSTRATATPSAPRPARAARGGPGAAAGPARSAAPARPRGASGPAGAAFLAGAAAGRLAARAAGRQQPEEQDLRFDQRGFPRHRAPAPGRSGAVRQRVLTTGVLAAVLAAPVVALWAGHQNGGGADAAATVSSVRVEGDGRSSGRAAGDTAAGPALTGGPGAERTTGQTGGALELAGALPAETLFPKIQGPAVPVPSLGSTPIASPALHSAPMPLPATPGPAAVGLLTVEAAEYGSRTVITMTNSGGTEIHWHAVLDVDWLRLSRDAGTLAPGQRITVTVTVDEDRAPTGAWTARIALPPSQAVVTLEGGPHQRGGSPSAPADPATGPATEPGTGPGPSTGPTAGPSAGTPAGTPTGSPGTTPATPPDGPASPAPSTPAPAPEPTTGPTPSPGDGGPTTSPSAPAASPSAGAPAPAGTGGRHQRTGDGAVRR